MDELFKTDIFIQDARCQDCDWTRHIDLRDMFPDEFALESLKHLRKGHIICFKGVHGEVTVQKKKIFGLTIPFTFDVVSEVA